MITSDAKPSKNVDNIRNAQFRVAEFYIRIYLHIHTTKKHNPHINKKKVLNAAHTSCMHRIATHPHTAHSALYMCATPHTPHIYSILINSPVLAHSVRKSLESSICVYLRCSLIIRRALAIARSKLPFAEKL